MNGYVRLGFGFLGISLCLAAIVLVGCATLPPPGTVEIISFEEPQQDWPTRQWGLVHRVDGVPFYGLNQLPPEPYEVRAYVYASFDGAPAAPPPEIEHSVARRVREEGGQAVLLTKTSALSNRGERAQADYLMIQFKTNAWASVLERINVYLALNPQATNQPGGHAGGVPVSQDEDLEKLRQAIQRAPKSQLNREVVSPSIEH